MPRLLRLHQVIQGAWPPDTGAIVFASVWELTDGTFVALDGFTDPLCAGTEAGGIAYGRVDLAVERAQRKANEQAVRARQEQPTHSDVSLDG